ncbi:MAG: hypothetical protein AMJ89_02275 [candidate division Zixibacteria bacterium SM23_73]|uniref:FlgD/Vpr Ig-like domain-containing protein n=1 Tax=candidate division WOR-1 bacterium DG_54_3 TaxID=1703775 RepID=A0A0S7XKA7_UNCSA|nr:MAG: hypothetical protein AMJ44_15330 [candidate division WOR-1 bacterium DG_54_3]KPK77532.1 MAG: hypothetical protein AMJ89_02275 [candidate division Zixibacteria bacterium SM23_73]
MPGGKGPESHGIASLDRFTLGQNQPNPFNPLTRIQYRVGNDQMVVHSNLEIYNILGQRVKTLVNEPKTSGIHEIIWDGKDENGEEVASGIYFYRLTAGDYSETKTMLLLR